MKTHQHGRKKLNRTISADIIRICLLAFLIAGISGCVSETEVPPTPGIIIFAEQASTPPSEPVGDSINIPGVLQPQYGVLIDTYKEDGEWISIEYWNIYSDGFVMGNGRSYNSSFTTGEATPSIVTASLEERQRTITEWQKRGYTAQITDLEGATTEVSNVFMVYDPPLPYYYQGINRQTYLPIMVDDREEKIYFSSISGFIVAGGNVKFTLHDGDELSGVYVPFTVDSKPFIARVYGVQYGSDGHISLFSLPFESLRSIVFLSSPVSK
jgi:hypothetical protein